MAVNLAIIGNSIDPMGYLSSQDLERAIQGVLENPVSRSRFMDLKGTDWNRVVWLFIWGTIVARLSSTSCS